MKERPILFNGEMVRAILEGRKTQTRRIIDVAKIKPSVWTHESIGKINGPAWRAWTKTYAVGSDLFNCPYGQTGDRLWVKETWRGGTDTLESVWYKASDDCALKYGFCQCTWKPSIFMPRDFSRITLEIVNVRVERLNEIKDKDALEEGYPYEFVKAFPELKDKSTGIFAGSKANFYGVQVPKPNGWYQFLWESINGHGSWDKNPWVWVIEFKRIV